MKLVTFNAGKEPRLGAIVEDQVVDLAKASAGRLPVEMLSFLALGEAGLEGAKAAVEQGLAAGQSRPLDTVKLMAPIPNPSKVIAIGLNYMDHCREQKIDPPKSPIIFTKFPSSIVGQGDTIRWDPELTGQVDYEAELAVVMSRTARRVSQAEALNYVAGYTICNDVSARDLQFGDGQWIRGKSLDTFCPLGPYLVTRDEIPNPNNLAIRCIVNDQVLQDSTTAEMIFQVPFLIEYISRAFTLYPGDVITTGTPDGVGVFRNPKVFLKDEDTVTVEIERLGQLSNPCAEESQA
jgi:2-keto-4-pentenoate hydratase/2-oxohepta-3-ene-1,7-dioic acid hydratase in catechol pathway